MARTTPDYRKLANLMLDEDVRIEVRLLWETLVCTARSEKAQPEYEELKDNFRRISRELSVQHLGEESCESSLRRFRSLENTRLRVKEIQKTSATAHKLPCSQNDEPS